MIRQALADFLLSQGAITAIVGDRIRPLVLAQNDTLPGITFRRTAGGHDPPLSAADDTPSPRFEIVSWARTYGGAVSLSEVVRGVMENAGSYTETWGDDAVGVLAVTYIDEQDTFAEDVEGGDKPIYGVQTTYEVTYRD